ncbi:hypothetical protein ACWGCW_21110 [Streptomyces sp. NPDC054933]
MTTVHQILFGWAERDRDGNAGVRPLAHSGPPTIDRWAKRLEYVWATHDTERDEDDRTASLAYLVLDDEAAVLRKLPSRNTQGRGGATLTHVLVGDPGLIDARFALGLHGWTGWLDREPEPGEPAQLRQLPLEELLQSSDSGLRELRLQARSLPRELLSALVARVMDDPAADFSVIAPPALALPLMTAVVDITGPVRGRPWTFASRESTDVGGHQPRVVFLSNPPPQSMYISKRVRIDPQAAARPPHERSARFGGLLADLYLESGYPALQQLRPRDGFGTAEDAAIWQRSLPVVDGRIADPRLHRAVLTDDAALESARERGSLNALLESFKGQLRNEPADWLAQVVARWGVDTPRGLSHPVVHYTVVKEAVQACLTPTGNGPAHQELLHSTQAAHPSPGFVLEAFYQYLPQSGLDLGDPRQLTLLVRALSLGLAARDLARDGMFGGTSAAGLLDFVDRYGEHWPEAGRIILVRHLGDGAGRSGRREGAAEEWFARGLLLRQVERIAQGNRQIERECYRSLLIAAYGTAMDQRDVADFLGHARDIPAGLLAAVYESASDDRAAQVVQRAAADRYFREAGHPPTALRPSHAPAPPTAERWTSAAATGTGHRPDTAPAYDPPVRRYDPWVVALIGVLILVVLVAVAVVVLTVQRQY